MHVSAPLTAAAQRMRGEPAVAALLVAVVAIATWPTRFIPPGGGLDQDWHAGLFMAADQGLHFGTDVVWTFGPLGFLGSGAVGVWFDGLAVAAFLYSSVLYLAFCAALYLPLRRSLGWLGAAVVAILAIGLLPTAEQAVVITVSAALAVLTPPRRPRALLALIVAGSMFAALQALMKLSIGPVVFGIIVIALIGARAGWRKILLFCALYVIEVLALWVACGQDLATLPDYLWTGLQVVSSYSAGMAIALAPSWQVLAGALAVVAVVALTTRGDFRDDLARRSAVTIIAVAGFVAFKEGVVRYEPGHVLILFSTISVLLLVIPFRRAMRRPVIAAALALVLLTQATIPGAFSLGLDPVAHARLATDQVQQLFGPAERRELAEYGRAVLKSVYALDSRTLGELQGKPVAIEPWEISIAWAYDLDWSPLPVIQDYQAVSEGLDRLNADEVASEAGPSRILRVSPSVVGDFPTRSIDGRYPSWDPPGQALATLCHFEPVSTTSRYQVLARTQDRCGEPQLAASVEADAGEPVDVPPAGRGYVVFMRIRGADVSGLERLRTLLLRAEERSAVFDDGTAVRLVPGTAADGLLLRGDRDLTGRGEFAEAPQTRTIAVNGAGDLRYEFFRMAVRRSTPRDSPAP